MAKSLNDTYRFIDDVSYHQCDKNNDMQYAFVVYIISVHNICMDKKDINIFYSFGGMHT